MNQQTKFLEILLKRCGKMIDLLNSEKYSFLKNNEDLKNIIYLTLSGSRAYGTDNEKSDIDLRGVLIEDKKYYLGLKTFDQFEDIPTDTVIYGLKKFFRLCADANPSALELLGTAPESIIKITEEGEILRSNASLFLSKKVINSFGNYSMAQLRRLQNALCHDSYEEKERTKHLNDTLNSQIEHFKQTYTDFDSNSIKIYENTSSGELDFDINLKSYPIKDFIGIYSELNNIIRTYKKLNHRNNKKDDAHLFKHAMHLIRLLIMGIDILDGKGIITNRKDEKSFLLDLRNGVYSFDEIFKLTNEYQYKFEKSAENTKLPDFPDMDKIEKLLISLYSKH